MQKIIRIGKYILNFSNKIVSYCAKVANVVIARPVARANAKFAAHADIRSAINKIIYKLFETGQIALFKVFYVVAVEFVFFVSYLLFMLKN